jgi:hypothetical protein
MAVGITLEFKGATLDQYDDIVRKMGLTPGGRTPPGGMFHWVTKTNEGFFVTDVWESREVFERFAEEKIGPLSQEAGIADQPKITFYEVHNYLTGG